MQASEAEARLYCNGKTRVTVDEVLRGEVAKAVVVKLLVIVRSYNMVYVAMAFVV